MHIILSSFLLLICEVLQKHKLNECYNTLSLEHVKVIKSNLFMQ